MLRKISSFVVASAPELLAISGAVCLVYGAAVIHPAGGWLMTGLVLALGARELDRSGG